MEIETKRHRAFDIDGRVLGEEALLQYHLYICGLILLFYFQILWQRRILLSKPFLVSSLHSFLLFEIFNNPLLPSQMVNKVK